MATILIIDDQSISRQILNVLIGSLKTAHEIVGFGCAREALAWAAKNPVALIVTDYKMPGMNGIDFIREYRSHPADGRIPVIMVSGDGEEEIQEAAFEAGADHFMMKPLDHDTFRELCRSALSH